MRKNKADRKSNNSIHPTRIFKNSADLFNAWLTYKERLKEEAFDWPKVQYVGKDGERREDFPVLPLTLEGFYVFCFDNYGCVKEYFMNRLGYYDDFTTICTRIKDEIRKQQITGGLIGAYNSSLTARLNGLKESVEQSGTIVNKIQNETDEELLERLKNAKKITGDF